MSCRLEPLPAGAALPLSQLHRLCFPDDPWDAAACGEILAMPGCFGLLAWEEAGPVGFGLTLTAGEVCEVLALGVTPERRRGGIGGALMTALVAAARQRGSHTLLLEMAEDNATAAALYAAHGFVAVGRRARYYRRARHAVDALVLRLCLG
ncbi:MAG: GNAT family N-acetyltransferase [Stellaceae bacterium]